MGLERESGGEDIAPDRSVGAVLCLVGSGSAGAILMALGQGPLRTMQLTERIHEFSPRSVYRCIAKLESQGLVERRVAPSGPSRVLLRLTEPAGRNLHRLLQLLTAHSQMAHAPLSWSSLNILGELWRLGYVEELSHGPSSLLELHDAADGLSYHQVRRRTRRFLDEGLLARSPQRGNGRHFQLTERARRRMVLVAGIARWRHRSSIDGTPGLELGELATVLRTMLPLILLQQHAGKRVDLIVTGKEDKYGNRETETLHCPVDMDGAVTVIGDARREPNGSAAATINIWLAALLDGNRGRFRVRGDLGVVDACLTQLYDVLWRPESGQPYRG